MEYRTLGRVYDIPHTPGPWEDCDTEITAGQRGGRFPVALILDLADFPCLEGIDEAEAARQIAANRRVVVAVPKLLTALLAAHGALRSYQMGNAAPDLAESMADHIDALFESLAEESEEVEVPT